MKKTVLIITPSLNPKENISGISSFSKILINNNKSICYVPFLVGKKDDDSRGVLWFLSNVIRPLRLLFFRLGQLDLVHFNIAFEPKSLIRDIFLFAVLKLRRIPIVLHVHGGRYMNKFDLEVPYVYRCLVKSFLINSRSILVLSPLEKQKILHSFPMFSSDNIYVVPNAVFVPNIIKKPTKNYIALLYLGRIDKAKGLKKIIDAVSCLYHASIRFQLSICGVGSDMKWLKSIIPPELKEYIVFEGLVYGERKREILSCSDFYLLPSDYEGLPISLLEAMAFSVIPIVSAVGSIPEVVNSSNGRLVESVSDIVCAIEEIASSDNKDNIAAAARQTILDNYSVQNQVKSINSIYNSIFK